MSEAMKKTATYIAKNGDWWELRVLGAKRLLGRSTSRALVERWKIDVATKGFIDDESNV